MASSWKTVRVFISSTFCDMHSERDWLVKRVFPALRERLEKYRVHLVDIDLRWGVTEQQAESGGALDVCLDQVDACRPFFLGLLGERYGCVLQTLPERVSRKYGWDRNTTNKSITELEILYGVLNDRTTYDHAFFCFRDPSFIKEVPKPKQVDVRQDDASAENVRTLKAAIERTPLLTPPLKNYPCRYAGLKINWRLAKLERNEKDAVLQSLEEVARDGLVDPVEYARLNADQQDLVHRFGTVHLEGLEEFGERVRDWVWMSVVRHLNLPDQPAAISIGETDSLAEEAGFHERYMKSRTRVYVGRKRLRNELAAYADGVEPHPCVVMGPSGSGKSAVLARFAHVYERARRPNCFVIPHFVGASPGSTDLRRMLERFCQILKRRFGFADEVPSDIANLIGSFRDFLQKVPQDCRVVLVIDALNQLDETDQSHQLHWLPWQLPPHLKVIVSCIDETEKDEPVRQAFTHRPRKQIQVAPLSFNERLQIVRAVPSLSAKTLDDRQISLLLSNPATTTPLFLLVALEELRGFGSYEQLIQQIARLPRPQEEQPQSLVWLTAERAAAIAIPDASKRFAREAELDRIDQIFHNTPPTDDPLTAIYQQVIERLEAEFDEDVVRSVLTLLASARRGLSQRELLSLIEGASVTIEDSVSDLFPVLRQLRSYLQYRGELLDFYHRNLFKAVRAEYLASPESRRAGHLRLAEYFAIQDWFLESLEKQRTHARQLPPAPRPANLRKVEELPWQVIESARESQQAMDCEAQRSDYERIEQLFQTLEFLEAKTEGGLIYDLEDDLARTIRLVPAAREFHRVLILLHAVIRRSTHFIAQHPTTLLQCLWNYMRWDDLLGNARNATRLLVTRWSQELRMANRQYCFIEQIGPPELPLIDGLDRLHLLHDQVVSVSISRDPSLMATASRKQIGVWEYPTGLRYWLDDLPRDERHANRRMTVLSNDGQWLLEVISGELRDDIISVDVIHLRHARSGGIRWTQHLRLAAISLHFIDALKLVGVISDGGATLFHLETGELHADFDLDQYVLRQPTPANHGFGYWSVSSTSLSLDGKLAVGFANGHVLVWDSVSTSTFGCCANSGIRCVAFDSTGNRLLASNDNSVLCLAVTPTQLVTIWELPGGGGLVTVSPCGNFWAVHQGSHVSVVTFTTREVVSVFAYPMEMFKDSWGIESKTNSGSLVSLRFSDDGTRLVAVAAGWILNGIQRCFRIRDWHVDTGHEYSATVNTWLELGENVTNATAAAWSSCGHRACVGRADGAVDVVAGGLVVEGPSHQELHKDMITALAYSEDGARLLSASRDGTLVLRESQTGECLDCTTFHPLWISGIRWSEKDHFAEVRLVGGSTNSSVILSADSLQPVRDAPNKFKSEWVSLQNDSTRVFGYGELSANLRACRRVGLKRSDIDDEVTLRDSKWNVVRRYPRTLEPWYSITDPWALSPDSAWVVFVYHAPNQGAIVIVYELTSNHERQRWQLPADTRVEQIAFMEDAMGLVVQLAGPQATRWIELWMFEPMTQRTRWSMQVDRDAMCRSRTRQPIIADVDPGKIVFVDRWSWQPIGWFLCSGVTSPVLGSPDRRSFACAVGRHLLQLRVSSPECICPKGV